MIYMKLINMKYTYLIGIYLLFINIMSFFFYLESGTLVLHFYLTKSPTSSSLRSSYLKSLFNSSPPPFWFSSSFFPSIYIPFTNFTVCVSFLFKTCLFQSIVSHCVYYLKPKSGSILPLIFFNSFLILFSLITPLIHFNFLTLCSI